MLWFEFEFQYSEWLLKTCESQHGELHAYKGHPLDLFAFCCCCLWTVISFWYLLSPGSHLCNKHKLKHKAYHVWLSWCKYTCTYELVQEKKLFFFFLHACACPNNCETNVRQAWAHPVLNKICNFELRRMNKQVTDNLRQIKKQWW